MKNRPKFWRRWKILVQKIVRNFFFLYKLRGFFCGEGSTFWQGGRLCGRRGLRSRPRRTPTEHLPKTNRKKIPKHIKEKILHIFCISFSTAKKVFFPPQKIPQAPACGRGLEITDFVCQLVFFSLFFRFISAQGKFRHRGRLNTRFLAFGSKTAS